MMSIKIRIQSISVIKFSCDNCDFNKSGYFPLMAEDILLTKFQREIGI